MSLVFTKTHRGFSLVEFHDFYGHKCSVQKSSLATEDAIWFGVDDAQPQVMASDAARLGVVTHEVTGWVPYPVPAEVMLCTRMHLSRDQVSALLPLLQHFVETGEVIPAAPSV